MSTDAPSIETKPITPLHNALRKTGDYFRYKIAHPEVPLAPSIVKDKLLDEVDALISRFKKKPKPEEEVNLLTKFQNDFAASLKTVDQEGDIEKQRALVKESNYRLFSFARTAGTTQRLIDEVHDRLFSGRQVTAADTDKVSVITANDDNELTQRAADLRDMSEEQLPFLDPESFLAHSLITLRQFHRQLKSSDLVITESIQDLKDQIVLKLTQDGIVALVGETGTGKTKMAKQIAEENFDRFHKDEEGAHYYFVMGHRYTSREDLLSYLGVTATTEDASNVPGLIAKAREAYTRLHPEPEPGALDAIDQVVKGQSENVKLQTEEVLGVLLKAAEEGKHAIVDEFNYINPALLAAANELMQVKPGQTITTPSGRIIVVKKGFGIIMTGNLSLADGKRYIERFTLDPALINRLNSGLFEYNTPPMADTDNPFAKAIVTDSDRKKGTKTENRELFQIALTELVDAKGNLYAPDRSGRLDKDGHEINDSALEQVWHMAQAFKIFQDNFAGKPLRDSDMFNPGSQPIELRLQNSHASMRTMRRIIESWKGDNFQRPLEYYLYEQLIRPAAVIAPVEAAYFHNILKNKFSFFTDEFWAGTPDKPENARFSYNPDTHALIIKANTNKDAKELKVSSRMKLFSSVEIAQAFSGYEMPQEVVLQPKAAAKESQEAIAEKIAVRKEEVTKFTEMLAKMKETIELFCADEQAIMGTA